MRVIMYVVILALLFLAPVEGLDIAKLEPVQTVAVYVENGEVVLATDTQNVGRGANAQKALADLEENTPGVIYLDTAEYLLVTEDAQKYAEQLRTDLRPSVKVVLWDGISSVKDAAEYLDVRGDLPELKKWHEK